MVKKKLIYSIVITFSVFISFAQEKVSDSIKKNWNVNLDVASRYIWRGQSWGGNYPVVQFYGNYNVNKNLSFGFWTTHNFKKRYYNNEGNTEGYQELDLVLNYSITDYLTVSVQDYFWPSTDSREGVSNVFFNFGNDSSQSIDLQFLFDFSEKGFPIWVTLSTLIAGNDFRYKDEYDTKGKQNFTTYAELGYTYEAPLSIEFAPVVGLVINNEAKYYTYADYDKPSFVNLGCKLSRDFKLDNYLTLPVWLTYTYNAASNDDTLSPFGRNLLVAGITLSY